ncbi:MAG: glutamine--fructose-6-phosphate transaminase (isomerizing) [Alphaproteobacteria bacterium]|nr:glutamine--fructose-6-phosphate transaminase (isomerizing) [Alphaproteobacteria bacterium]
MCGIIGIIGKNDDTVSHLIEGLRRLEYRGYDSTGIATLDNDAIARRRAEGKLQNLERLIKAEPIAGNIGIGHTRWATHGAPTVNNAHPHGNGKVALVHNGIIENFHELQKQLSGVHLESETDTEVVVHLISDYLDKGLPPEQAVHETLKQLKGAFALVILFRDFPDMLIGARKGSPLVVGYGGQDAEEYFFGSDALALAGLATHICYLEDGDWAVLKRDKIVIYDEAGTQIDRPIELSTISSALIGKGNHKHYMLKEIYEQPTVLGTVLSAMLDAARYHVQLPDLPIAPKNIEKITIIACGTASYAGMVGKYWIEQWAGIPVEVDIASEFRYRTPALPKQNGLCIIISQSGETMDTLEALRYAKQHGQKILAIVNVEKSTIDREADQSIYTRTGPEISVASTKAFTSQLVVIALLAQYLAQSLDKSVGGEKQPLELMRGFSELPSKLIEGLNSEEMIKTIARDLQEARDVIFLGRGKMFPIALEGALKLKEISYIHAEGYAAGELKHGPIALIDEYIKVVVLAPYDALFEKILSNMQEVISRNGKVILISDRQGIDAAKQQINTARDMELLSVIEVPSCHQDLAPILYSLPVQLLAYHTALIKGVDIDQPRNLAKSVTVE